MWFVGCEDPYLNQLFQDFPMSVIGSKYWIFSLHLPSFSRWGFLPTLVLWIFPRSVKQTPFISVKYNLYPTPEKDVVRNGVILTRGTKLSLGRWQELLNVLCISEYLLWVVKGWDGVICLLAGGQLSYILHTLCRDPGCWELCWYASSLL